MRLVLGTFTKEKSTTSWVIMVNVAATRAKKWFYIIGDKRLYK
ncbi:hypothetical protein [Lactobacillus taiwanensis]|nr:hypothetical protein [Lactobacillus taiwanensis]